MAAHDAGGSRQEGDQAALRPPRSEAEAAPAPSGHDASERVSIVIPAHNEANYIEVALASVSAQDYPAQRLECVVVDNASTDGTAQRAGEYAARHAELDLLIVAEPSLGVARAKNRGACQATGAILIFLDADSRMTASLARDVVSQYHAGAPAGSIRIVADSDSWLERGFFDLMELGPRLFGIRSQMFYCDRALFLALGGFDETLNLAEDLEFLRRVKRLLRQKRSGKVCHIRTSVIATSPRRLRRLPHHLSLVTVFVRWALAHAGIGRRRTYSV